MWNTRSACTMNAISQSEAPLATLARHARASSRIVLEEQIHALRGLKSKSHVQKIVIKFLVIGKMFFKKGRIYNSWYFPVFGMGLFVLFFIFSDQCVFFPAG